MNALTPVQQRYVAALIDTARQHVREVRRLVSLVEDHGIDPLLVDDVIWCEKTLDLDSLLKKRKGAK